ncbi:MAG: hypothetical protein AAGJ46_07370 [Planctomycetota bacterium]
MAKAVAAAFALGALVGVLGMGDRGTAVASHPVAAAAADGSSLASHLIEGPGQTHTLVLVDGKSRRVCVYHINATSGVSTLKSARDVTYDLQLDDFNTEKPSPQDVLETIRNR